jgi:hypothetical protein
MKSKGLEELSRQEGQGDIHVIEELTKLSRVNAVCVYTQSRTKQAPRGGTLSSLF